MKPFLVIFDGRKCIAVTPCADGADAQAKSSEILNSANGKSCNIVYADSLADVSEACSYYKVGAEKPNDFDDGYNWTGNDR